MDVLSVKTLNKSFNGIKAIDDLTLSVPAGSVYGFIGPNGAGKTTTIKSILGLLPIDSGEITVCGEKVRYGNAATNRHIGYLPDVPEYYNYMKPSEYLGLCGEITGMDKGRIKSRAGELLELTGLNKHDKKIGSFSRGMKQRLGIAQSLINEPDILICDEPTSALDPVGRRELLNILHEIRSKTTVIFSTHILSDVERICDRVGLINKGHMVLEGTLKDLKALGKSDKLIIEFRNIAERDNFAALKDVAALSGLKESTEAGLIYHTNDLDGAFGAFIRLLNQSKIIPIKLEAAEPDIESLFMEAIK
jgi:ABC-2 type transport system ATP-binding protein